MKRFLHIPLRVLLLHLLLLVATFGAMAQETINYSTADGTTEHWYVIRFNGEKNNKQYAIKSDETNKKLIVGEYSKSSAAADAPAEFRWKLIESAPNGERYLVNTLGEYVGFDGTRFTLVAGEANASLVHLVKNGTNWEIQRIGITNKCMNAFNGLTEGNEIHEWDLTDGGNVVKFDPAEGNKKNNPELYLQFSAYGRLALYDDGTSTTPVTETPKAGVTKPEDAGYTWTKTWKGENFILHSGRGRYLAVNAAGDGLIYTDEGNATEFTTPKNPYYGAATDPTYTALRAIYQTADGKAIAINPADGSVVLVDASAATRATVIHETREIDGIEPPVLSGESTPVWYNITFTATGDKLALGGEGTVGVAQSSAPFDPSMMWSLEKIDEDKFYIKSHEGGYLAWDETNGCFTATGAKAAPAVFRLSETGLGKNTRVLHYVDATGANLYLQPTDAKDKVVLGAVSDLAKACVTFKVPAIPNNLSVGFEHTPQEVFYSDATHDYWYVIRFCNSTDKGFAIRSDNAGNRLRANAYSGSSTAADAPDDFKWKFIPSDEAGYYHMVSKTGTYVKFDGEFFVPVTDKSEAAKLHLIYDLRNQYRYAWQIQRKESTTDAMHPRGSFSAGSQLVQWTTTAENDALQFDLVEETDIDLFLQFSSYGRRALYDDNGTLTVKQPAKDVTFPAAEAGYTWTKSALPTGGYTLKSDRGNYIALEGNSLKLTGTPSEAATFRVMLNPYGGDMDVNNLRPVNRFIYVTGNKALSFNEETRQVVLTDIGTDFPTADTPAGRATVIRETHKIDGTDAPIASDAADPVWYCLTFTKAGLNLSVKADGSVATGPKDTPRTAAAWQLEKAGSGTDLYHLKNFYGKYLQLNGTTFATTNSEGAASTFRLSEYAETGADRDKWVLQCVDAEGYQYLMPADNGSSIDLTTADVLSKSAIAIALPSTASMRSNVEHSPQQVFYSTAEDATPNHEVWYMVRFMRYQSYAMKCESDYLWSRPYSFDTPGSEASDEFKWKFIPSDEEGWYHMVCKNGMYVKWNESASRYSPTVNKAEAAKLHIISVTNNTDYPFALQIQRKGSSNAMNPHGGTANNSIGEDQTGDGGNSILFELLDEESPAINLYLQFSSYGRLALRDNGGTLTAAQPEGGEARPAGQGYLWTKTRTPRGYTLKSDKGNYITANGDGSLSLNASPDAATHFATLLNPYTEDVAGTGGRSVYRFMFSTKGKVLSVDPETGNVALIDCPADPARSTILRETTEIDGVQWPKLSTEDNPMWYDIQFSNANNTYLSVGDDADKTTLAEPKTAEFNPALVWRLEDAGQDLVRVKGYKDAGYLAWSGIAFTAKADEAGAALFRVDEFADAGANRDKWVLHYVGATDANQYLKPNDAKDKVVLAAAGAMKPAALYFEEKGKTADIMNEAQPVYFSTDKANYWYVIRFCANKDLVLRCDEDMLRVGSYPADSPAADAPDNMKWKLEVSDQGEYYLVSKTGKYVHYTRDRFRTSVYRKAAGQLHLIYNTGNDYPYAWQIQCWGSGYSMNPNGGLTEGKEMGQSNTTDRNDALLFEPAEDFEAPLFLQFSSYGRLALYDTGDGNAPEAREADNDVPTDPGFTWIKTRIIEDGYTLRSGNGNYIGLNDDGTALVMTADKTKAVTFHTKQNPYAENVFDSGQRLVHRKMYYIGDKNTASKAITVDPATGSLSLTPIEQPATRATVIRETNRIDASEAPRLSTDDAPVWYNILFTRTGNYLTIGTSTDKWADVQQSETALDAAMMWRLETSGSTDHPDEFFLKNRNGDYLKWIDTAKKRFAATANSAEAAPFRLAEYIENGPDRDKWALHYVASKNDAWIQYLKPTEKRDSVAQTPATDPERPAILFKKTVMDDPDYCTADGSDWRLLYFYNAALNFDKVLNTNDGSLNAAPAANNSLWKNVKNADGTVSLKNWDGQYIALNEAKTGFILTTEADKAAHFTIEKTDVGGALCATWLFSLSVDGKEMVLAKDASGNIVLLDKDDESATAENTNFFLGDKVDIPTLNPQPGEYFTIALSGYLHDGLGDDYDAKRGALPSVHDESMVVTNDYLWTFVSKDGGYQLQSRNGNYLKWGTDKKTLDITTNAADATILGLDFTPVRNASNGTWTVNTRLKVLSGTGITEEMKSWYLNFSGDDAVLHKNIANLTITKYVIYEPENYTAYKIIPKRSWFIRQVDGQEVESNSFIHSTSDGSYGIKTSEQKDEEGNPIRRQNTNDYRVVRYMKRNTMREFRLPTSKYGGSATPTRIRQYQRWYNYDTDGLVPDSLLFLNKPASRNYKNGTLIGEVLPFNGQANGDRVTFGFNFKMPDHVPDDFEYTLGIDMSFYTDFVEYYNDNGTTPWPPTANDNSVTLPENGNLVEPTLAQRCIYVVRNAHFMAKELTALSDKQGKWLEEYNVHFPAKKVNFRDCSLPLENEFANYWIYKDSVASEENLIQLTSYNNLEFVIPEDKNKAGISLAIREDGTGPIVDGATGAAGPGRDLSQLRFFRFKYPTTEDGREQALNGSTADIEVYAKDGGRRYRLAVYHLTFDDGTELRPHAQIIGMKDDGTGQRVPKSDRSPRQLRRDLGEPKAKITFDFDTHGYRTFQAPPKGKNYATKGEKDAGVELPNTYRFPLLFENTSYAFEPTAIGGDSRFNYTDNVDENAFGAYTIARTTKFAWNNEARFYPVRKYYHDAYPDEDQYNYENAGFLYIDASECPGRMASLDFDGNICKGTRITVSAWVSSPNSPNRKGTDVTAYSNVFFNVLGYYTDANGVEQEEKIYTYCPGPFGGDYRVAPGDTIIDGDNTYLPGDIIKSETDQEGVWQQIYFSFIPRSEHIIHRFVLNVNNACTSSAGGDILIDDIEVYSATPQVKVTNTLPVCNSTITLTQIEADYETMMNALGLEDKDLAKYRPSINYCVVDSAMYQTKLKELQEAHDPTPANNAMRYAAAGDIRRVVLNSTFEKLPEYSFAGAAEGRGAKIWRLVSDNGAKQIVISDKIISDRMRPNTTYYLAAYFTYSSEPVDFSTFQVGTECSISSLFTTRSSFIFNVDGDNDLAENGDVTVCAGSNVTLSAKFRGTNAETGAEVLKTLPCDWWLGYYGGDYAQAYINADGTPVLNRKDRPEGAFRVSEALENFRFFYPTVISTEGCTPKAAESNTLTQAMIDGLDKLSRPEAADAEAGTPARPALLLLFRQNINVQIPDDLGEEGKQDKYIVTLQPIDNLTDFDEDGDMSNCIVCFDADTLTIRVDGHAPGMLNGFATVDYPAYMSNVPLRLTLPQLNLLRGDSSDGLSVPLRKIEPVTEGIDELVPAELEVNDGNATTKYTPLYIADTDDPKCDVYLADGRLREVGRIKSMYAKKDQEGHAVITLLGTDAFAPREGYTYTLRADYKEKVKEGTEPNTCNGSFVFDVKVVPRYVVWTAAAGNAEWTNDLNWRRADRADLLFKEAAEATEPEYLSNEANGTAHAFVPLKGTGVIISPLGTRQPALTDSTFITKDGAATPLLALSADATPDITYDLIVGDGKTGEGAFYCTYYRTNRCAGLVLQAGAELAQAQHLDYDKAWVEYELAPHRWYTLGTPLKQVYAGDWYAPTATASENAPYFHPVTFSTTDNDRFNPAVYQRGWAKSTANLYVLDETNPKNVAVLADWSSVYNDVAVPYDRAGFSLKAEHGTAGKVLFRLPKEDTFYEYYKKDEATGNYEKNHTEITRTEGTHHRLWTDELKGKTEFTFKLTNDDPENLYFLVGNPFPCALDVDKFFTKNAAVDAKYWIVTAGGQSAAIKNTNGWITVNGDDDEGLLAPGQGFFVKAAAKHVEDNKGTLSLTFTPDMMATTTPDDRPALRIRSARSESPALRIRATRGTLAGEAVVVKSEGADDAFVPAEDMETLLDTNIDDTPTVYTLAGNRAATVNSRRTLCRVPLGVAGRSDDEVTLTFTGMNSLDEELSLLDTQTGEQTPLTTGADSISVSVPGHTAGRYFLISPAGDDGDGEADDGTVTITVRRGEVTVKALGSLTLDEVQATATDGRMFHRAAPEASTHKFRLAPGIYLITTRTALGTQTRKIVVK